MQNENEITLASFVLPTGVLDYFSITKVMKSEAGLTIYLDENNLIPQEYAKDRVISKGFYEESSVQDFPIRGKAVYLCIRRRRWFNESTGDYICRDWNLVATGTRMTQEFASFLKAIAR
jgi:hypothetical protein